MDRAYQNMLAAAKERLKGKNPYEIARNANIIYDEKNNHYLIRSLGKEWVITYPDFEPDEKIEDRKSVV